MQVLLWSSRSCYGHATLVVVIGFALQSCKSYCGHMWYCNHSSLTVITQVVLWSYSLGRSVIQWFVCLIQDSIALRLVVRISSSYAKSRTLSLKLTFHYCKFKPSFKRGVGALKGIYSLLNVNLLIINFHQSKYCLIIKLIETSERIKNKKNVFQREVNKKEKLNKQHDNSIQNSNSI